MATFIVFAILNDAWLLMPLRNFLVIFLAIVVSLACYSIAAKNRYATLFAEVLDVVDNEALQDVPREELFVDAINGMLRQLDQNSNFIFDRKYREMKADIAQEFGGVGMFIGIDDQTKMLSVVAPMPGTPAFEAGILAGDLIVSIEGQPTAQQTRDEAIERLRGPIGQPVAIEIKRGEETLAKSLKRAKIEVESTHGDFRGPDGSWNYHLQDLPNIGYVRLSQFGEKSTEELRSALESLSPKTSGLILDLRSNPGGLLDAAVSVCDMFLDEKLPIVKIQGRNERLIDQYFSTTGAVIADDVPVCILVDRFSASASEIVAGCLQDHDRAILIGEQSYGKGTVQDLIPIQRNKSVLKLTTASYWRPSGQNIDRYDKQSIETQIWGVQPNPGFAVQLTLEQVTENRLRRDTRDVETLVTEQATGEPAAIADATPPDNQINDDDQLAVAPDVDLPLQTAIDYLLSQPTE